MGKTGTTTWIQVKGVNGQIRLVPQKEGSYKKPGPNQRFKSGGPLRKAMQGTQEDKFRRRGGNRGGRGRGGAQIDKRFRRRIKRATSMVMGLKQASKR
ncbi:MAG: DUF5350 domain-containing protein [Methanomicrobiaceae archaeon]|nr:DUF5350 domain-containing protein [Methanomicrobiaceae archaeon]